MSEQNSDQTQMSKTRLAILLTSLGLLLATPVALLILLGMGQVQGVEFSPDDFSRRSFSYNQMPLTGWVLFKKTYNDKTTDLDRSLVASRLVPAVVLKMKRWHLISESGSPVVSRDCDARFLTGYLDKFDDDGINYWDTWNTDFPKSAKVFWPYVAQLARDEMYLKVADVMRVAMSISKDNPKPLERELQSCLSEVYFELGSLDIELGQRERAEYRLKRSVQYDSSSPAVQKLESLKQLKPETDSLDDEAQQ